MSIDQLRNALPAFAKDIKLNLGSVLTPEGSPDLNQKQISLIALSSGFATSHADVISALLQSTENDIDEVEINAAKSAATIMAMNNVYYRFLHMVSDKSFASMPAKLRMNVIANSGIAKSDFELCCLAVSALNGCGMCIDAHTGELVKAGVSKQAIQSCVKIAAVINATALGVTLAA